MVVDPVRPVVELTLVEALELEADHLGLSDRALMLECGIDQSMWVRVRQGTKRFGPEGCARIVRRFPHLRDVAARYLAGHYGRPVLTLLAEASRVAGSRGGGRPRRTCR